MSKVLLVDDEAAMRFALSEVLDGSGVDVLQAGSVDEALPQVEGADVVVTDFAMPGKNGLELLDAVRAQDPTLPVIVITAHGSERIAVEALKRGAYDYIAKPFDNDEVSYSIRRALETRSLRRRSARVDLEQSVGLRVVGESPALQRVLATAGRLADKDVTVLVRGETGTGKELFATLLHARSKRAKKPLVKFNCAAIPHDLAEAQLFGYTRGAFTGATNAHTGYFQQANGGTLVLDEIGELSLPLQSKLLRVLQEREVQPLGSTKLEKIDVRLLASTHRDLAAEVKAGRFREDLYYRIAVVELVVPSLRERKDDIPLLAREFARKYSERFGLDNVVQLAPEFLELLMRAPWPGNVRQLENAIARCVALATGDVIGPAAFELIQGPAATGEARATPDLGVLEGPTFREQMEAFERNLLTSALAATANNQSEAARRLGLNRATLYDRLKKYGLLPEAKSGE
ncbi:MAG TPA: sigma-54 dependent transcriptional regulator [Polyangiales bacterium]|nr:sigma-54 dependent transcriptional regulator [Polyangiales bacterium]